MQISNSEVKKFLRKRRVSETEVRLTVRTFILRKKNGDCKSFVKAEIGG